MVDRVQLGEIANRCWEIYAKSYIVSPGAPQEFRDLVDAITKVQITLKNLDDEVADPVSGISRAYGQQPDQIHNVVTICTAIGRTLEGIERLVNKYQRMVGPITDISSLGIKLWGKVKWATEKRAVVELRNRLLLHTSAVNLQMCTLANSSIDRLEEMLETLVESVAEQEDKKKQADAGPVNRRKPSTILRKPVEMPGSVPDPPVELDSLQISRPPERPRSDESDATSVSLVSSAPQLDSGLQVVEQREAEEKIAFQEEFGDILDWLPQEKVVVDMILDQAEDLLRRHGRASSVLRSKTTARRFGAGTRSSYNLVPALTQAIALTYDDLPPEYNTHGPRDIIDSDFKPGKKISESFRLAATQNLELPNWPKTTRNWFQLAAWWLLKCELMMKEKGGPTQQTALDLAKASWILNEIIPPSYVGSLGADYQDMYSKLVRRMQELFVLHWKQEHEPFTPSTRAIQLLEPQQAEEHSPWLGRPVMDDMLEYLQGADSIKFRAFVALEFGLVKPPHFPSENDMNYLFSLHYSAETHTSEIIIRNQTGTLCIRYILDDKTIGPYLEPNDIQAWVAIPVQPQTVFAGFGSEAAAVPYSVERNFIRRELLERPQVLYSAQIEKARYLSGDSPTGPLTWSSLGTLKLMEMRTADNQFNKYRELVMEGQFTTCKIPVHVVKIVPSSHCRVTMFWPSFDSLPVEDIRDYMHHPQKADDFRMRGGTQPVDEEYFLSYYARHRLANVVTSRRFGGLFLDINFRPMKDRVCDIEVQKHSNRMIDMIFRNSEDMQAFTRYAGGTGPWSQTEVVVFKHRQHGSEIHLFRELDDTFRLCYAAAGLYCNFHMDTSSTYLITPELDISLWNLIWCPTGNIMREPSSYLPDALVLPISRDLTLMHDLLSSLFPDQSIAILHSTKVSGYSTSLAGSLIGRGLTESLRASPSTIIIARVPNTSDDGTRTAGWHFAVVLCADLRFTSAIISSGTTFPEMRKLVVTSPPAYAYETKKKDAAVKITFRKICKVMVRSYQRDRSRETPFSLAGRDAGAFLETQVVALSFCVESRVWREACVRLGLPALAEGSKSGVVNFE